MRTDPSHHCHCSLNPPTSQKFTLRHHELHAALLTLSLRPDTRGHSINQPPNRPATSYHTMNQDSQQAHFPLTPNATAQPTAPISQTLNPNATAQPAAHISSKPRISFPLFTKPNRLFLHIRVHTYSFVANSSRIIK